jgi:hypothetical protein
MSFETAGQNAQFPSGTRRPMEESSDGRAYVHMNTLMLRLQLVFEPGSPASVG